MSLNKLMFQVGIEEVEKKIADIRAQYDSFADKYAGGIAVKLKLEGIETAISGLEKMGDSKKLKPARDEVENLKKSADATTKSFNVANMEIARLYRILRVADSTSGRFADLGFDTSRIENYKRSLIEVRNTLETIRNNGGVMPGTGKTATAFLSEQATSKTISNLQAELNYYKQIETQMQRIETLRAGLSGVLGGITDPSKQQAISAMIRDLENLNGVIARSSSNDNIARFASVDYRRVLSGAKDMLIESRRELKATDKEAQNAEAKIRTLGQAFNNLKNYSKQNGSSDEMKRLQAEIQETIRRMRTMMNEGNYKGASSVFSRHQADIKLANAAIRDYERAQRQAANATNQTASAQQHLSSSVQSSNRALMSQSSILSDLKSLAKQYLGVWGAQTFFNKIIETGGLLEQQRLSIGAILGNTSQANQLFGQIQKLAVKSPFGVVQLDTMSKQLTAYNFKYHELYDWTKRLADISAATGTEVSRLSLALGHVRSEGALSGYTLRQFAMGNVPLLQTLAKQLGKTTSEIRKMVRGKEISYEDVATALKSLTENGGMFENAQEVMSGALNAKFKNLRDAFDIMYGQMAESLVGDALKKVAETLTVMAKHWEETGAVVLTVAGYFGIQRLSMMAANQAMVQGNLATGRFTASQIEAQVETGNLTRSMLLRAVASGKVAIADVEAAGATLGLSRAQLLAVRNSGKVSAAMNTMTAHTTRYTLAQIHALNQTKRISIIGPLLMRLRMGWYGIAAGAKLAGDAIKGFMASMWPLLAISVLVEGVTRYMKKISDAKERVEELRQAANEGYKNLEPKTSEFKKGGSAGMNVQETKAALEDMETILKDYSPQSGNILSKAFEIDKDTGQYVKTLAERYDILAEAIDDVKQSYLEMGKASHVLEAANDETDGIADESFRENTEDYIDALSDRRRALEDFISKNRTDVIGALARTREAFAEYDAQVQANNIAFKQTGGKEGFGEDDLKAQIELLNTNQQAQYRFYQEVKKGSSDAADAWEAYGSAMGKAALAQREMDRDLETFVKSAKSRYEVAFGATVDKWTEAQRLAVQKQMEIFMTGIDGYSNLTDKERMEIEEKLLKDFNIKIDVDAREANKAVTSLVAELNGLIGREWVVHMKLDQSVSATDAVDRMDKAYNDALKVIERYDGKLKGVKKDKDGNYIIPSVVKIKQKKSDMTKTPWGKYAPPTEISEDVGLEYQFAQEVNWAKGTIKAGDAFYEKYGIDSPKQKGGKTGKLGGKGEDQNAKAVRERIRVLKEVADSYQYWRDKVGETGAWKHVQDEFGELLERLSLTAENADDLRGNLKSLIPTIEKIKDPKIKTESFKELNKELAQLDRKDFEKRVKDFVSKVTVEMETLTRTWEMFNSVREATGDVELAVRLSGADYESGKTRNLADALRKKIQDDFSSASGIGDVDFDINLSDEDIDKLFKNAGKSDAKKYESQVESLVEQYKKWRDLQRDVWKNDVSGFTKLIGVTVDYESQLKRINSELKEQIASNNRIADKNPSASADVMKANDIARFLAAEKLWKNTNTYATLFNDSLSMSRDELLKGINMAMTILEEKMRLNLISAHEYAKEMEKLRKIQSDFESNKVFGKDNAITAFAKGGLSNLNDFYSRMIVRTDITRKDETKSAAERKQAEADNEKYKNSQEKLQSFTNAISGAALVVEVVRGVFDGLQQAAQNMADMFDALGHEGSANTWSDIADTIGAIGSVTNGASNILSNAMSGNIGGVISSAISAPFETFTAPITAFAKLHDKKRERELQGLREDVQKIDNTLNLIKSLRERTLGYDNGDRRRQMAAQYKSQMTAFKVFGKEYSVDDSASAMYEYYSRGGLGGNGYTQELNALKKQREDYQKMYDVENDNKKKSTESLEEYKTKMAELDEKIMYYTEDLARELWSIDIKGWADQIGDALVTAFKNGTSMAEAYHDAVENIMSDVVSNMMKVGIIEPMFEKLRRKLFGYTDEDGKKHDGVFDIEKPEESAKKAAGVIAEWFGTDGEGTKTITAANEYLTQMQKMMEANGLSIKSGKGTSAAKSVQSTITEETGGMLYGVFNAFRQDASVMRMVAEQFVNSYWANYMEVVTSASDSLRSIEQNTNAIFRMMNDGQGAMFDEISSMRKKMDSFTQPDGRLRVS